MTFAIAGSLITQSDTDTNLSGLAGVAGVTTLTNGTKTVYNVGNNRINVSGTLTFDPRFEEIQLGSGITSFPQFLVSGTLNIGSALTENGYTFAPPTTAIIIPSFSSENSGGSNDDTGYSSFRVTGTCHHYYGTIFVRGPVGLGSGATTGTYKSYSSSSAFISLGTAGSDNTEIQIRQRSTNNEINGITTNKIWWVIFNAPAALNKAAASQGVFAFAVSGSSTAQTFLAIRDYAGALGNTYDAAFRLATVWLRFINSGVGTLLASAGNNLSTSSPSNCGIHELRQELYLTAKNTAAAAITSGGIYLADKNNGNRCPYNTALFGGAQPNYTTDREYSVLFNGSGLASITADGGVLIGVNWRDTAGARESNNQKDLRGEDATATDFWIVRCRSYGKVFTDLTVLMRGVGGTLQNLTMFDNANVTQASATADAHTGITLTDHGGSPVSWNGKNFGVTITGNRTTNPSLTTADIYHHLQAKLAAVNTTFHGKVGGAWHEMLLPDSGQYSTVRGQYGGARTYKGVRVVDENGDQFPGVLTMQSDDGTYYSPPVQYQLTISGFVSGSDVVLYQAGTTTVIQTFNAVAGTSTAYTYQTLQNIDVGVFKAGYKVKYVLNYALTASNATIPITQEADRNYA